MSREVAPDIGAIIGETAKPRVRSGGPPHESLQEFVEGVKEQGVFRRPGHEGTVFGGVQQAVGGTVDATIQQAKDDPFKLAASMSAGSPDLILGAIATVVGYGKDVASAATAETEGARNEAVGRSLVSGVHVAGLLSLFKGRGGGPRKGGAFDVSGAVDDAFKGLTEFDLAEVPQVGTTAQTGAVVDTGVGSTIREVSFGRGLSHAFESHLMGDTPMSLRNLDPGGTLARHVVRTATTAEGTPRAVGTGQVLNVSAPMPLEAGGTTPVGVRLFQATGESRWRLTTLLTHPRPR